MIGKEANDMSDATHPDPPTLKPFLDAEGRGQGTWKS